MKKITLIFMLLVTAIFSWQSNAQLSYNNACTNAFDDISSTGTDLALADDGEATITIPFGFTLDGVTSTDLVVGNNGGVLFGVTTGDVNTGFSVPTASGFYPFNDDIDSDYGSVYWETLGTAPNRRVVILWNDRPHYSNSPSGATFELILHETTNEITFLYQDTDFGAGNTNNDAASAYIWVVGANGNYVYSTNQVLNGVTCINWVVPTCLVAADIVANGTGTTTGEVSWTDNNGLTATDYEYVVQAQGTGTPTVAGTPTTANPQPLTGLTASTAYEVYLRANCGSGDFSEWRKADFVTQCNPFNDFTEDFDSSNTGEMALCWSSYINSTSTSTRVSVENTDPYSGANAMELYNDSDDASSLLLITPNLADMQNADHRIRFMAKGTGTDPAILVGTMTDPTDFNTFVPFQGIQLTNAYAEYSLAISTPPAGANYIAFQHGHGATFQTVRIDDFVWELTPSCIEPSDIFVNAITASGASISWTENNSPAAANWDLYIVPTGNAAPDAASTPTLEETAQPVVWTGGAANTTYDVYVRTDCGNDNTDVSTWTGPVNFTTSCDTYMAPYIEGFEDAGAIDQCWTQESADILDWTAHMGSTTSSNTGPSAANSGDYYIYVETSGSSQSDNAIIYSPNIDITALTTPRLNFAYHMYGAGMNPDGSVDVAISTDGGANYTSIFNQVGDQGNQWNSGIVDLSAYTGVVSFRITGTVAPTTTGNTYENDFAIDDFKVEETPANAPNCAVVTGADTSVGCGDRGVTLSWDAVAGADGYRITCGTTTGGNDIADNQDLGAGLTFAFPSTPNTDYFYTVIAYNAIGDATGCTESSFTSFATGCLCESVPTSVDGTGITNVQLVATDFPSLGDTTYYQDHTATVVDIQQVLLNNLQISFNTSIYDYNTNVWIDLNDDLVFDNATELVFQGNSSTSSPNVLNASFTIPSGSIEGNHAMRIGAADTGQTTPNPCYNGSYGMTYDFIVNVLALPTCLPPTDLTASNITDVSADLSWISGGSGESLYDIEIVDVTAGGTATGTATYTDQANPYALSSLTVSNDYQYYVRSNCGGGDYSIWAGPFDFSTTASCVAPSNLLVANVDAAAGTADLEWTDTNPTAPTNGWEYEIVDITAGGTATGTGVATATNPVSVSSLVAGNQYEFLVRAICDSASSSMSDWSTAFAWTQMDIPGCVTNPMPADTALIPIGLTTFTWDVPTNGGAVASYDVYAGITTALEFGVIGNVTAPTIDVSGFDYATTYYWKVVAKNAGGESVGCNTWSFTTVDLPSCGDTWTDLGGVNGNYNNNANETYTFTPDTAGEVVTVTFTNFNTEGGWDGLMIYDGPDTSYPVIDSGSTYNRTTCPNGAWTGPDFGGNTDYIPSVITSSDASGALTFVFKSDSSGQRAGWEAAVTCAPMPTCHVPTDMLVSNLTTTSADLTWTAGSDSETMWEIVYDVAPYVQPADGMADATAEPNYNHVTTTPALSLSGLAPFTYYDVYYRAHCGGTDYSDWSSYSIYTGYCIPSGTSQDTYIDIFTTTNASTNINNSASGFSTDNYGDFSTMNVAVGSSGAVASFDFNAEIVGGTAGFAIWVDWNNDLVFDMATENVFQNGSYGNGPFTGTITVPAGTADGSYRMRLMVDWNDSLIDDDACSFNVGRGEVEDYTIVVDSSLSTNDLATVGFNYYPNPVNNTLTMTANENITSVSVFNMLGQEVKNEKLSTLEAHVDMSNLANGTYFVKAQVGQTVGTFKVVKK